MQVYSYNKQIVMEFHRTLLHWSHVLQTDILEKVIPHNVDNVPFHYHTHGKIITLRSKYLASIIANSR